MNPGGKGGPGGLDSSSMKISANFIHVYPLKKANFSSVWHGPLTRWLPFEHSSTKTGSLNTGPVYSTLCPSTKSIRSTSKFHLNMLQYSIGGDVMTDTLLMARTVQCEGLIYVCIQCVDLKTRKSLNGRATCKSREDRGSLISSTRGSTQRPSWRLWGWA